MSTTRIDDKANDIPEKLVDVNTKTTYKRLRFFGKVAMPENPEMMPN
jgi:hypothetical protein